MEWTTEVGCAYDADIDVGTEDGNVIEITIQLKNYAGKDLTVPNSIRAYWASNATGLTYAVNDLETDLAATTSAIAILVANGVYQLVINASGLIVLDAGHSGASTKRYLVLVLPNGKLIVSNAVQLA